MWIDGHFPEWKVLRPDDQAMFAALDLFILLLTQASRTHSTTKL
jgi:hypothetical protein